PRGRGRPARAGAPRRWRRAGKRGSPRRGARRAGASRGRPPDAWPARRRGTRTPPPAPSRRPREALGVEGLELLRHGARVEALLDPPPGRVAEAGGPRRVREELHDLARQPSRV